GTLGSVSTTTIPLSSPVGIGWFVFGHLVRIGAIGATHKHGARLGRDLPRHKLARVQMPRFRHGLADLRASLDQRPRYRLKTQSSVTSPSTVSGEYFASLELLSSLIR